MKIISADSDTDLLFKIKGGDNKAFEALYYRYFSKLSHYAFKRLQEEDLTEEIVQDVFVELWKKRETWHDNGNVAGLLFAILRNKALHELRTRLILNNHMEHYTVLQGQDVYLESEETLYEQDVRKKMDSAVARLSPQCRQAFKLNRYEHLSYKEIAVAMNISLNTVEKHIGKALKILREEFHDYQAPVAILIGLLDLAFKK